MEHLYRLIERWEMAYIADEPGGAAGTLVHNLGVEMAELYIEDLQHTIAHYTDERSSRLRTSPSAPKPAPQELRRRFGST